MSAPRPWVESVLGDQGDGPTSEVHLDGLERKIWERLMLASPIRRIAQVVQTGSSDYRKVISLGNPTSGWVSETMASPDTAPPKFAEIAPPYGDLFANPAASPQMLDDSKFDLEGWLAHEIATEFGAAELRAFVIGSGVNQPKGFLGTASAAIADGDRPFGVLQHLPSGDAHNLGPKPAALLCDAVMALKSGHRQGAVWVMNPKTLAAVRKLRDEDGVLLWQPGLVCGQTDRLLGYPVVECAEMPDITAGAAPIAFGNFQNGYVIAERFGTRVLRDPYSNKPFVNFHATRRIGGQVLDSEAIKLVKVTAA